MIVKICETAPAENVVVTFRKSIINRVAVAIEPIFKKGEVAMYESDYRKELLEAAKTVVGPLTVFDAWQLYLMMLSTRNWGNLGDPNDSVESQAADMVQDVAQDILIHQRAATGSDIKSRMAFFGQECMDEGGSAPLWLPDIVETVRADFMQLMSPDFGSALGNKPITISR